jgi:catechol 2,3-dioxygenase-like lactoylglutathione lyase family enzyme
MISDLYSKHLDSFATEVIKGVAKMIFGTHVVIYSKDADADRRFLRDVMGFRSVDAGHGWLIFALPPAEAALHPAERNGTHELYFLCDDLKAEIASLAKNNVACSAVEEARWGSITRMQLPGGGQVGIYQPKHPTAPGIGPEGQSVTTTS